VNWIVDTLKTATGAGRPHDLSIRTPFYHPDFPVIVMWSEKSACTIIAKWFFHHIGHLEKALAYARWIHKYENDVFKARPGYKRDCLAAIKAGKPIIKFTRNPYARAYSGYLETCNPRVLREPNHWSTQTRKAILQSLKNTGCDLEQTYSFAEFISWMSKRDVNALDLHIAPQVTEFEQKLAIENVRLEDLRYGLPDIEDRLDLPSTRDLKTVHTSGHHHPKKPTDSSEAQQSLTTGLPVKRPRGFRALDISPELIAQSPSGRLLRSVFQADFEAYGYDNGI